MNKKEYIRKKNVRTEIEGVQFDNLTYEETGVFIWRNAISQETILDLQQRWNEYFSLLTHESVRKLDANNPVNFTENLPDGLHDFWQNEAVKNIAKAIFTDNVALYNHRIVMKDKKSDQTIFLHQDYCYHVGFPQKCSLFIPIFDCGLDQGGMTYYLGSHQYGYLGDAGEIDETKFDQWPQITPELNAGDVVIMNSLVWHKSGPNLSDCNRVLFDIIIQPSNDPSGIELVVGEWKTDFWIDRRNSNFKIDNLFVNSRTKKLKNYHDKYGKIN
jgi:hypothetical protein